MVKCIRCYAKYDSLDGTEICWHCKGDDRDKKKSRFTTCCICMTMVHGVEDAALCDDCAGKALELGAELLKAIERGRRLHPWVDDEHMTEACQAEIDELMWELYHGEDREQRIYEEAVDVFVCAYRLREGK